MSHRSLSFLFFQAPAQEFIRVHVHTSFLAAANRVYRNGFKALLIGRTNTVIQENVSPDIDTPFKARKPEW